MGFKLIQHKSHGLPVKAAPEARHFCLEQPKLGVFYPDGTKPGDYLARYAEKYDCVEIDSTFYRVPPASMIKKWYQDTPKGFLFAAKVPQVITHEKVMVDCEPDMATFLKLTSGLKERFVQTVACPNRFINDPISAEPLRSFPVKGVDVLGADVAQQQRGHSKGKAAPHSILSLISTVWLAFCSQPEFSAGNRSLLL